MSSDPATQAKEAFYAEIDFLDASLKDDDEEDLSGDLDLRKQSRAFFAKLQQPKKANQLKERPRNNLPTDISTPKPLTRATTLPAPTCDRPSTIIKATPITAQGQNKKSRQDQVPSSTSFVEDTPFQNPLPSIFSRLNRSSTTPASLSSMVQNLDEQSPSVMSGTNNKTRTVRGRGGGRGRGRGRGKANDEGPVPEIQQVLKGLRLFYVPEPRSTLGKARVKKVENYGAVTTQDILDCTHVIVENVLNYNAIKDIIAPILGKDSISIANDQWPLMCIEYKRVIPISANYLVWGVPASKNTVASGSEADLPTTTQASENSLQLKAPHNNPEKWDYVPPRTPSQIDASPVQRPNKRKADSMSLEPPSAQEAGDETIIIPSSQGSPEPERETANVGKDTREHRPTSAGEGDELSHLINRVREEFKDLPRLGEEDGCPNPEGEEQEDDTDEEPSIKKRKKPARKSDSPNARKKKNLAEYFACNRGGTKDQSSNLNNPNARTIAVLKQMLRYYEQTNDHWRLRAYRNAINTLSRIPVPINTADEAEELPYFGKRLSQKVEEIVNTNTLQRLKHAMNDPTSKTLSLFLGIYGVGKTTADKWIAQGFRTLEDLTQKTDLNANQKVGIEHYKDINTRIPRAEVAKIGEFVCEEAARIDGAVKLLIGGSYRRGADSSGDVDFIITKPGTTSSDDLAPFLEKLVGNLTKARFLTAELASHGFGRDDGGSKWHGCCVLPSANSEENSSSSKTPDRPIWRRIDFLLVPETEYGAALIYFTGNDIFNRSIRLLASRKGMRLNQRGLYKDVLRGPYERQKLTAGELIEGKDEKRIFEILGVKWREPEERWC